MKITKAYFKNCGPIEDLFFSPLFNTNGTPRPQIFVGTNGSGKTILLSHIADLFVELAKKKFRNVTTQTTLPSPYFRLVGPCNLRHGAEGYSAIIEFQNDESKFHYCEHFKEPGIEDEVKEKFPGLIYPHPDDKRVSLDDNDVIGTLFEKKVFLFFPDYRTEASFWSNKTVNFSTQAQSLRQKISNELQYPFIIEEMEEEINAWLIDVFLDARVDLIVDSQNGGFSVPPAQIANAYQLKRTIANINRVLATILDDETARIVINFRNHQSRFSVEAKNADIVYPLANLSAGQKALFSIFGSILMVADKNNIQNSISIEDIEEVVVIDEIDKHIHDSLAYKALPQLIKSFPKVQFFITTHSPTFILGMQNVYSDIGVDVIEMPSGRKINPEEYSEFKKSLQVFQETQAFQEAMQKGILGGNKPMILAEGETDPQYIKTYLESSGKRDILERVDIEWIGTYKKDGGTSFTGKGALNQTRQLFEANPKLLSRKTLLLYDGDTNKPKEDMENLSIRSLTLVADKKAKKGIENLLSDKVFTDEFYVTNELSDSYGGETKTRKLNKTQLCESVCQNKNLEDFEHFNQVLDVINEWLESEESAAMQRPIVTQR